MEKFSVIIKVQKLDRIAVLFSVSGVDQLLWIPADDGSALKQASAVIDTLNEWEVALYLKEMCFDTPPVNTGIIHLMFIIFMKFGCLILSFYFFLFRYSQSNLCYDRKSTWHKISLASMLPSYNGDYFEGSFWYFFGKRHLVLMFQYSLDSKVTGRKLTNPIIKAEWKMKLSQNFDRKKAEIVTFINNCLQVQIYYSYWDFLIPNFKLIIYFFFFSDVTASRWLSRPFTLMLSITW